MVMSAPACWSCSLIRVILEAADSPANCSGCISTAFIGTEGLPSQSSSAGSMLVSSKMPDEDNASRRCSVCSTLLTHPSMPTVCPACRFWQSHSVMVGVSGKRSFMRWKGVQANCSSAARKYLLSVHSAASWSVITAVPALPLNPLIHSLVFQWSGIYSPL